MGFNESLCQKQVRFHRQTVDQQLAAGGQRTDGHQVGSVIAIMHNDLLICHDLRAEFICQFLQGCLSVASGGNEDRDLRLRISPPNLRQHRWQNNLAGHRSCVVTGNDHHIPFTLCQFL